MVNRRRSEVLDTIIDTIILNGPIKRVTIPEITSIAMKTIDEWVNIIMKIQAMPILQADGEGKDMVLSLDISRPEDTHLENAIAFFNQANLSNSTPDEEVSEESEH